MSDYVRRTLTYLTDKGTITSVGEAEILSWTGPLIVLGEPGMGKTELLRQIAKQPGWTFRSAAGFVAHPAPANLVPTGQRIVIDGLDELSAANESDPVYRVLTQLIKAGCPPFILSCRAADWRGAVARQDITEEYSVAPIELSLEPFSRDNAVEHLAATLGVDEAERVIDYIETKSIPGLYGNPLTLGLFGEVAAKGGDFPDTRGALMQSATEIMWNERNDRHDRSPLSNLNRDIALRAAGAASAAFILTGSEGISLKPAGVAGGQTIAAAEVRALPGGGPTITVIGSRLFSKVSEAGDQYKPIHRAVAEYLGAHWLAGTVTDDLMRERALVMMTIDEGVPASLRGIHAWLAHDDRFADQVIKTDPYGVLRYGDADSLTVHQGRTLLHALKALEQINPYFRAGDWGSYSAKGLTHPELIDDFRVILFAPDTSYHLRTLLLGVIHGSDLALALDSNLVDIMFNAGKAFGYAERHGATQALIALESARDWQDIVQRLVQAGDEDSTRLALEVMDDLAFEDFEPKLIARAILAHLGLVHDVDADEAEHSTTGTLYLTSRRVPETKVAGILNAIADHVQAPDPDSNFRQRSELSDVISRLVARQIAIAPPAPLDLLRWLKVTPGQHGYSEEGHKSVNAFIASHDEFRHAIQRKVIFEDHDHDTLWARIWRLGDVSHALSLRADDTIFFLGELIRTHARSATTDDYWRDLASLARRADDRGQDIIVAARPYAVGYNNLEAFLIDLAKPAPPPEWQVKQDKRYAAEQKRKEVAWAKHRQDFSDYIDEVRAGALRWSLPISQAYLRLFSDSDKNLPPAERIGEWLGPDLQVAGLIGLDAVLTRDDLPSLKDVAGSYAQSQRWNFIYPMIVGLVERLRTGRTLDSVPLDVVLAVRIALLNEHLGDRIGDGTIADQLDAFLRTVPEAYEQYIRLSIEPALAKRLTHVVGMYRFARAPDDRELARRLSKEWLNRFNKLPVGVEIELIDVLADAGDYDALREFGAKLFKAGFQDEQHQRNWLATGLLTDFAATASVIGTLAESDRDLLWHLRHRLRGGRSQGRPMPPTTPAAIAWIVAQFRALWPYKNRPSGVSSGDTNDWDASDFVGGLITHLAADTSAEAADELEKLVAQNEDGYLPSLLYAAAQQRRARREINFPGVTLETLKDIIASRPPRNTSDLLAIVRHTLARVKCELRGNDTDSVVKYWTDEGQPRNEDRCTDALIEDIDRLLPQLGITRTPQADMPKGKIADIIYTVGDASLPVEAKGQWNPKLWTAAHNQLDALYLRDWRTQGRGIYLVYWFGSHVEPKHRLKSPPGGTAKPTTPDELRDALIAEIAPARRASIWVEVLDLTR